MTAIHKGDAAHGVLGPADVLPEPDARALVERVTYLSKADRVRVAVTSVRESNVRFADNQMSTAGTTQGTTIRVESIFGRRKAAVSTNDRSESGLRRAVEQSEALARLAPEDPEDLPDLGPQTYAPVPAWFDATATVSAEDRARAARAALEPARAAKDVTTAGFLVVAARSTALGNSSGLFAYHRETTANFTVTVRTNDGTGSGWAGSDENDWARLDVAGAARRALEKARASRNPQALEPGRYTVILEPQAAADLIGGIRGAFGARGAEEGRSPFSQRGGGTKVGERIFDPRVAIVSDPRDPLLLGAPFAGDGSPVTRQVWVEHGVLKQLAYDRFWAQRQGKTATGGLGSFKLDGGTDARDAVVATAQRAILVTRCWYLRVADPRALVYTGLTRDGTFLVEGGKVVRAIKNFRFNESPLFILNNVEAMSAPERTAGEGFGSTAMPWLRVRDFNFTSLSDAV